MTYGTGILFNIPLGDYEVVDEYVRFDLNIPVKVVYYLHWLNDRLTDPDAAVPYTDEVLHCSFCTEYGLR